MQYDDWILCDQEPGNRSFLAGKWRQKIPAHTCLPGTCGGSMITLRFLFSFSIDTGLFRTSCSHNPFAHVVIRIHIQISISLSNTRAFVREPVTLIMVLAYIDDRVDR